MQGAAGTYPVLSGISSFVDDRSSFYEGGCAFYDQRSVTVLKSIEPDDSPHCWKRVVHRIVHSLDIKRKRERFFARWLKGKHGTVLDIGCGIGHDFSHVWVRPSESTFHFPS